jgi:hypothetical protein
MWRRETLQVLQNFGQFLQTHTHNQNFKTLRNFQ